MRAVALVAAAAGLLATGPGLRRRSALSAQAAPTGAAPVPAPLAPGPSSGFVFHDLDGDGRRDPGERGLADVLVSDQEHVVRTDTEGRWSLPPGGTGAVFVVVPRHHRATTAWWQRAGASLAFGLARAPEPATVTLVHASDTHIQGPTRGRTERLRALVDSLRPDLTLITGDLVRDALRVGAAEAAGYYAMFAEEAARFRGPVHTVPGNHEVFGVERARSGVPATHPLYGRAMYRAYRGPDYYAFDAGGAHFIALNTVDVDDQWYHGHVDSLQLAWLARDLAEVPAGTPVITFNHIPFFSVSEQLQGVDTGGPAPTLITVRGRTTFRHTVDNALDVLRALDGHPYALALAGHVHLGERVHLLLGDRVLRFHQGSATVADAPVGPLRFPSGITVYRLTDGRIDDGTFVPLERAAPR